MLKRISVPNFGVEEILTEVESKTKKKYEAVREILKQEIRDELVKAENEYIELKTDYFKIKPKSTVKTLTNKQAISVYENRVQPILKNFYSKELGVNECPICGSIQIDTIDHVLPKSKYTQFTVTPINLVPICSACNRAKGASSPNYTSFNSFFESYEDLHGMGFRIVKEDCPIEIIYEEDSKLPKIMKLYDLESPKEREANKILEEIVKPLIENGEEETLYDSLKEDLKFKKEYENNRKDTKIFDKKLINFLVENYDDLFNSIDRLIERIKKINQYSN